MTEKDYKYYLEDGISKTNEGFFNEALLSLEKAQQLNPQNALIYFSKGIAYHNLKEFRAAYENYDKAIKMDNKMTDAYYNKAHTILEFEDKTDNEYREALSLLEKATELDEDFIDAYYYTAVTKKQLGLYESAIESLDIVINKDPRAVHSRALRKLILTKHLGKEI